MPFHCYSGRTVISEIMVVDEHVSEMISNAAQTLALRDYAREHGMVTMRESAKKKVLEGITSAEEMLMATMFD